MGADMAETGTLVRCEEAQQQVEQTEDPVTRNLLNMAFVHFVRARFCDGTAPSTDIDMSYVISVLKEFLSEHEVLARTLGGETVGAWFDNGGE
jgi:hypothetical protein